MKDTDKVLISAYLDNDLSEDELQYVETLLDESSEAKDYLNQMKTINNEVSSLFNESLKSPQAESISDFIESKHTKANENNFLWKIFSAGNPIPLYSASAILALSIGLNLYFFYGDSGQDETGLLSYSTQLVERNELKTRSIKNTYDQVFSNTLLKMHNEKNSVSRLKYGSEVFLIKMEKLIHNMDSSVCYEGSIESLEKNDRFVFCLNQDQETRSFIVTSP